MSVASPTLLPRSAIFPVLLPRAPQPHPIPPSESGHRPERFSRYRDIWREMEELSEEEDLVEDLNLEIKNRGFSFLVPIGRTFTQKEEKNDADDASDDESGSDDDDQSTGPSMMEMEEENDSSEEEEQDLDADMEDMDEAANITGETAESDDMAGENSEGSQEFD